MKKVYALVFLVLSCTSFAQSTIIRGLLKDATTKEPVISASVGIQNTGKGTISNEDGVFQLTTSPSATIIVACLGYKTLQIPASEFTQETKTIVLEQSEEMLEEVMVTKTPLYQILREVIAVSRARFNRPINLHTYYREFVKLNSKYAKFSDGLLDYHISGNYKKTSTDLIIRQNRSIFLAKDSDLDEDESESFLNIQKGVSNGYDFSGFGNVINKDNYEDYDFDLKLKKDKEGNERYVIKIEPKTEIEKALYKGSITYDPKNKLIFDAELYLDPSHKQFVKTINFLILKFSFLDVKYKSSYKIVNNNYVMAYNNRTLTIKAWNKKRQETYESRSDLIVTDFEKDDLTYNKKQVFKKKDLYSKPSHYTEKFWQKNNAIVLTAEEEKIIASLEKEVIAAPKAE